MSDVVLDLNGKVAFDPGSTPFVHHYAGVPDGASDASDEALDGVGWVGVTVAGGSWFAGVFHDEGVSHAVAVFSGVFLDIEFPVGVFLVD